MKEGTYWITDKSCPLHTSWLDELEEVNNSLSFQSLQLSMDADECSSTTHPITTYQEVKYSNYLLHCGLLAHDNHRSVSWTHLDLIDIVDQLYEGGSDGRSLMFWPCQKMELGHSESCLHTQHSWVGGFILIHFKLSHVTISISFFQKKLDSYLPITLSNSFCCRPVTATHLLRYLNHSATRAWSSGFLFYTATYFLFFELAQEHNAFAFFLPHHSPKIIDGWLKWSLSSNVSILLPIALFLKQTITITYFHHPF